MINYSPQPGYMAITIDAWPMVSVDGLTLYQLEQGPNEIGMQSDVTAANLITAVMPLDNLSGEIERIEIAWNQWNCSPGFKSVGFIIELSHDGGTTWTRSGEAWRTTANGTKVVLTNLIPLGRTLVMNKPKLRFTLNMYKVGGYSPRIEENLLLWFYYKISGSSIPVNTMSSSATIHTPSVTAISGIPVTVYAGTMTSQATFNVINEMNSWNGTHATINTDTVTANFFINIPQDVYATGALHGKVEPGELKAAVAIPEIFIKDQETIDVYLDDVILTKEIELEVTLYDL